MTDCQVAVAESLAPVAGAVMSAKVDSLLLARWAGAHLPRLTPAQLADVKSLTTVGGALVALLTRRGHSPAGH
jgi:hypothetical protein